MTTKKKSKLFTEKDLIRNSNLKTPERFILYLIHEFCGADNNGYPTQKTLVRVSGICERRVRQAIHFLRDNGILDVKTKRKVGCRSYNRYSVNFLKLSELQQNEPAPHAGIDKTGNPKTGEKETPTGTTCLPEPAPHAGEPPAPRAGINERGNETLETKGAEPVFGSDSQDDFPKDPPQEIDAESPITEPAPHAANGRLGSFDEIEPVFQKPKPKPPAQKPNGRKPVIGTISPSEFSSLDAGLSRFYEFAEAGLVQDNDHSRLNFLTDWIYVRDKSGPDGTINHPSGAFMSNITFNRRRGSNYQEDQASRFLLEHDRSQRADFLPQITNAAKKLKADKIEGLQYEPIL